MSGRSGWAGNGRNNGSAGVLNRDTRNVVIPATCQYCNGHGLQFFLLVGDASAAVHVRLLVFYARRIKLHQSVSMDSPWMCLVQELCFEYPSLHRQYWTLPWLVLWLVPQIASAVLRGLGGACSVFCCPSIVSHYAVPGLVSSVSYHPSS